MIKYVDDLKKDAARFANKYSSSKEEFLEKYRNFIKLNYAKYYVSDYENYELWPEDKEIIERISTEKKAYEALDKVLGIKLRATEKTIEAVRDLEVDRCIKYAILEFYSKTKGKKWIEPSKAKMSCIRKYMAHNVDEILSKQNEMYELLILKGWIELKYTRGDHLPLYLCNFPTGGKELEFIDIKEVPLCKCKTCGKVVKYAEFTRKLQECRACNDKRNNN